MHCNAPSRALPQPVHDAPPTHFRLLSFPYAIPCRRRKLTEEMDRERASLMDKYAASGASMRERELEIKLVEVCH